MGTAVVCGGVGAAKLLAGMVRAVPAESVTAIVNVGDDVELHGLHVSPDVDTVVYTVAGAIDPERGWGLADETWHAMEGLERYGAPTWFSLGDRDLATHLFRSTRLAEGASLSQVTSEIAAAWKLGLHVVPATDDPLRTMITLAPDRDRDRDRNLDTDGALATSSVEVSDEVSDEVSFQEYFVRRQHSVPVAGIRFAGADDARPAPGVLEAIADADAVVIAPSNPLVSIDPVLAVPGVRAAVEARRDRVVAVSPIVGGRALKGPADRMLSELGHEQSVVGVARHYAGFAGTLVVDHADAALAADVEAAGMRCRVTGTIMRDPSAAAELCSTILRF
ncbi:MAG TPA: 2-phospho-L-lactate transferase [Acidimicrobiales bacterium]|nr:2-phospho-L-lactate transferase [Acidimicrobiales bacterium]